jgi:hypothetical protein
MVSASECDREGIGVSFSSITHIIEETNTARTSELFPYISTLITVIVQKAVRLFTEP